MVIDYKILEDASLPEMVRFMETVDSDFKPPLKERAVFSELVNKVLANGVCYAAFHENRIIGAIMFYCNDLELRRAYINYFAVLPGYRRNGIGRNLMGFTFRKSLEQGMERIGVHTWISNKRTLETYKRMGFSVIANEIDIKRVLLEKMLV